MSCFCMIGVHFYTYVGKMFPNLSTIGEHLDIMIEIIVPQKEERQWQYNIVRYKNY